LRLLLVLLRAGGFCVCEIDEGGWGCCCDEDVDDPGAVEVVVAVTVAFVLLLVAWPGPGISGGWTGGANLLLLRI